MAAAMILSASASWATLIEVDLISAGDGLVSRDTLTGLDWLDLTATTDLSYDQVEADADGWIST